MCEQSGSTSASRISAGGRRPARPPPLEWSAPRRLLQHRSSARSRSDATGPAASADQTHPRQVSAQVGKFVEFDRPSKIRESMTGEDTGAGMELLADHRIRHLYGLRFHARLRLQPTRNAGITPQPHQTRSQPGPTHTTPVLIHALGAYCQRSARSRGSARQRHRDGDGAGSSTSGPY